MSSTDGQWQVGDAITDSVEVCVQPEDYETGEGCARSITLTREDVAGLSDDEVRDLIADAVVEAFVDSVNESLEDAFTDLDDLDSYDTYDTYDSYDSDEDDDSY
ncbi:hypothetical protein C1Y63_08935 [Corynebacterium sp. 13CS0277]|nr:hypothetical protein C1Y63_08935 [Corynebacterium sp. 13CS0277]